MKASWHEAVQWSPAEFEGLVEDVVPNHTAKA
jgi:hypothetical protein